ncbi:MAG: mechanosensitive ion channel family protein [Candidatus Aminicenantes bacterium]|nr:mechanosensitive ion channel family protein [Candidatus Aminicenantes bacterium]
MNELKGIIIPGSSALLAMVVLLIIRTIAIKLFQNWSKRSGNKLDNILIRPLKTPSIFWILAIGLYLGLSISNLPAKYVLYLTKVINIVLIFSITLALANMATGIFRLYLHHWQLPLPTTGLFYGGLKALILSIGFLIILNQLGLSITPLITALGIGGLAVALALQDTLANLFAGVHILIEKSIRVGDFIRLETGQEGYVEDISWRTTRIRMLPNNLVVIPNSKLAQSIITNYYLPEKKMSLFLPIKVSYSSDPEIVEALLLEEAKKAIGEIPGLLAEPEPVVRLIPGFGDNSLDFTLICQISEVGDQFVVQHELRKRIFRRFQKEGIKIPLPQRVVYLHSENKNLGSSTSS